MNLQSLAWIGADGQVHTVKQPENGVPMLGAARPALQNLAWLGEDGQVHTVHQSANGIPMLGSAAPLQNLVGPLIGKVLKGR